MYNTRQAVAVALLLLLLFLRPVTQFRRVQIKKNIKRVTVCRNWIFFMHYLDL